MTKPFFSVIIPTKDRPRLLENALYSLSIQTFKDFEVIVSDNFTTDSCRSVVDLYQDKLNIKYYKPDNFLIMADNFEFAYSKASGVYATILEDKFMFYPFALEYIAKLLEKDQIDYVLYPYDHYTPQDTVGTHQLNYNAKTPYSINSLKQIKKHLNFEPFSITSASSICRTGCVMNCFFKTELIEQIKKSLGKSFFLPPAPDLTAQIFLSLSAKKAIYTGFSMVVTHDSLEYSTGKMQTCFANFMKKSWIMLDPLQTITNHIPYPKLTASISNFIAANYRYAISLMGKEKDIVLNEHNILFRIQQDMERHVDRDDKQIEELNIKIKEIPYRLKLLNKLKNKYGFYFNKHLVLDYLGIKIWPFNHFKKYKILKKHRNYLSNNNDKKLLTIEECLAKGDAHYKSVGFLNYPFLGNKLSKS